MWHACVSASPFLSAQVFNVLLQLLDDGRLTDAKGNVVNFSNCIIIFTSNIGSSAAMDNALPLSLNADAKEALTMRALKQSFRPEFLNRIDEFVHFNALELPQLMMIVNLEIQKLVSRLSDKHLTLTVTAAAAQWLVETGHDPAYGARPLKRTLQREVETPLAQVRSGGGDTIERGEGDAAMCECVVIICVCV